ncbi:CsbD family protein [Micromonospora siamensis]|uniref:CsbD-like n=1 Tax=Micromonospora siamensis TaxID=299152 RepID=A0A1C5H9W1_9ACTN|nr:CsbD family protein [Micromonospora siamensis]SCG42261.1 CsbD-like [Micromonospora siamensis]
MGGSTGIDDTIGNASEEAADKLKEGAGRATDDERLEAKGRSDQASANVKQAGEKIRDAFNS